MIDKKDFQIGTVFVYNNERVVIDEDYMEVLMAVRNYDDYKPVDITLKILRDNFGFEVYDMGEFWQAELEEFLLVQPKFQISKGVQMPFIFGYKTTVDKAIAFKHVHHLQAAYRIIQQKELVWKVSQK